jgi:hypothetical protein
MGVPGRFIMGAFALFFVWTLVRDWRRGKTYGGAGWSFDADDNPLMYGLTYASHVFIVVLFAAGAAGYRPSEVLDAFGLGWINSFHDAFRRS